MNEGYSIDCHQNYSHLHHNSLYPALWNILSIVLCEDYVISEPSEIPNTGAIFSKEILLYKFVVEEDENYNMFSRYCCRI